MKKCMILAVALSFAIFVAAEKPAGPPPAKGSEALEKIKSLVGTWTGDMEHGDGDMPAVVSYRLTGGGSAVVETFNPDSPMEMVSVYHDHKGKLTMTHYCMLGNQPKLRLTKNQPDNGIAMSLVKNSIVDPETEMHMGGLNIKFISADKMVHTWTFVEDGKGSPKAIEWARKK